MASSTLASASTVAAGPAELPPALPGGDSRWQLRLVIALPTMLVLVTLAFGLISYLTFSDHWEALERIGAETIAGELLRAHLWAMLGLSAAAAVAGVALAWSILRPIGALIDATRRVALGRLDVHASPLPAAPELQGLARSFNAMIDELNRTIAERNRCLLEGLPVGVLTADADGRIQSLNRRAAELLGVLPADAVGRPLRELGHVAHALAEALPRMLDADATTCGRELALEDPNGSPAILASASPLRDGHGRAQGAILTLRDAAQMRDLSAGFSRVDQLAMLGTFTLGLAHELRNPLGAINGLGQLLSMEPDLPATARAYVERMTREIARVDDFVRQLLELTEQPPDAALPVDLGSLLTQASELARLGIADDKLRRIEVRRDIDDLPPLPVQPDRLRQAFVKILHNAYEFTPPGGAIRILARRCAAAGRSRCEVVIHNTGSAIDPAHRERIFEPFFTTRRRATGLGLTIARQIIVQNGGTIEVRNQPDGVAFVVAFDLPAGEATYAADVGTCARGDAS